MPSYVDQTILVTGACSGIGRQLVQLLLAEGAAVAALDSNADGLAQLANAFAGKRLKTAVADVTDLPATRSAIAELQTHLGPVDLLIASAGIGRETSALKFRAEDVASQINVNLIGVANSIDAVLPSMLERRRGHLAVLSSLASFRGLPMMAGYCSSKAGVSMLLASLRTELKPKGIDVTIVRPGWIRTPLTDQVAVPHPYMMEVEYAARVILEGLRRRKNYVTFPGVAAWQLRILSWLPTRLGDWAIRRRFEQFARWK